MKPTQQGPDDLDITRIPAMTSEALDSLYDMVTRGEIRYAPIAMTLQGPVFIHNPRRFEMMPRETVILWCGHDGRVARYTTAAEVANAIREGENRVVKRMTDRYLHDIEVLTRTNEGSTKGG